MLKIKIKNDTSLAHIKKYSELYSIFCFNNIYTIYLYINLEFLSSIYYIMTENTHLNDILSNHGYEHKKVLGQGAFSSVHLCYNKKYYHNFAIKRARKHKLSSHEYQTLISLSHPNIIKIYDAFEDDTSQYLVMEYCSQGTLRQKSIFSYDKFIYYARQILEAIAYCHSKKVSHRDVKPDNIFIDQYDHVKLADFGLAKEFRHNEKTTEKCGSLMFFAPEMLQFHEIDPFKADIWALGVTFFFMATGCFPFQSESREELKQLINLGDLDFETHDVDPQIRFLISKMTTKNVKLRPTAEKFAQISNVFSGCHLEIVNAER